MSRHVVAGILCLALAGCALDRSLASRSRSTLPAVEMTPPLGSINETINQENARVDPDSVRAGHPTASDDRPRSPRVVATDPAAGPSAPAEVNGEVAATGPADRTEPQAAGSTVAPAAGGRPAPFAGLRGAPRRRSDEPAPAPAPAPAPPVESPAPAATDPLDVPAEAANPSAPGPEPEAAGPAEAAGGPSPAGVRPAQAPAGESPPPATEGRVKISVDGSHPSEGTTPPAPSSKKPLPPGRDPLLGADPDVMPTFGPGPGPATPKGGAQDTPAADPAAPPELPAALPMPPAPEVAAPPAEVSDPGATGPLPEPKETGPAPVVRLSPPTELEPAPAPPAEAPAGLPEPTESSAPSGDPLLGPNPDVMPNFTPTTPHPGAPAAARESSIPPSGGRPPSVSEIVGVAPAAAPAPSRTAPASSPAGPLPAAAPSMPDPAPIPAARPSPTAAGPTPPAATGAPAPSPPPGVVEPPTGASVPAPAPAPAPARDPLLGAKPEIMPSIELPAAPPSGPSARPAPAPKPSPAPAPAASPTPGPAASNPETEISEPVELPPSGPEASTGAPRRSSNGFASVPVSATAEKTAGPVGEGRGPARPADPPASDPTAVRSRTTPRALFQAGTPVAWVGESVITLHELQAAYKQRRKGIPAGQEIPEGQKRMLVRAVLNDMVDREMVIQEARRELKDPKRFQKFMEVADKVFFEEEVPPMLRQTASADVPALKKALADRGESLDEIREQFRLEFLSRGYMEQKLGPKMRVDLSEMREYYLAHLKDFDTPAQVVWREVLVEVDRSKTRAEARRKADALLARLRRGDDFAAVAKSESDGPNRSDGGLWKTSPGSYGVPAVNSALDTLPVGRVSPVIEGPTSYHVVVVESRRQAGPATFAEVQDKVHHAIRRKKIGEETTAYMDKLRSRTVIRTVNLEDPGVTRTSAEVARPRR